MLELLLGRHEITPPYLLRKYGVTEEEFNQLIDEDTKAELLDGVMIVHSPTTWRHDDIEGFLLSLTRFYAETRRLGKVSGPNTLMHLATCRKFAPDVLFVGQDRVPSPLPKVLEDAADLVVEILSESTRAYDLGEKRQAYHEAGIPEIWFVDDDNQQIRVDRKGEQGYTEEVKHEGKLYSQVIQGFWIEVSWLWQEPLPPLEHCLQAIRSSC